MKEETKSILVSFFVVVFVVVLLALWISGGAKKNEEIWELNSKTWLEYNASCNKVFDEDFGKLGNSKEEKWYLSSFAVWGWQEKYQSPQTCKFIKQICTTEKGWDKANTYYPDKTTCVPDEKNVIEFYLKT